MNRLKKICIKERRKNNQKILKMRNNQKNNWKGSLEDKPKPNNYQTK